MPWNDPGIKPRAANTRSATAGQMPRTYNSLHFSPPLAGCVFFGTMITAKDMVTAYTRHAPDVYQTYTRGIPDASRDKHEIYTTYTRRIHDASPLKDNT
ncbi:hypothetical protein CLV42_104443 [Chitinophaga ginsengisoli]|uniref:Uncharacterized protein n=1 Tax=Chitinophaga ginsengisoli TaxID=363837 RepID=A0A2P8GDW4_9BACT|nr:hypothetical protein CLV42_104443 [Chitinophaga ginsengisoli]